MEIFNMGDWSKRVPKDERIYEKHESVPHNPKIADVSFRSGDVESWGRGFLKIKAECNKMNAPLPVIDAENGGVSIHAAGCEKYMSLLRYGQYGQVGADGVRRDKEEKSDDKKATIKSDDKRATIKSDDKKEDSKISKQQEKILNYIEADKEYRLQDFCDLLGLKETRTKAILKPLINTGRIVLSGKNKDRRYRRG